MEISENEINKTAFVDPSFKNRDIYRSRINYKGKYSFNIAYRNTELFVAGDKDIKKEVEKILEDIYGQFDIVAKRDPSFMTSLTPVKIKSFYPPVIKKMCMLSSEFKVGPMASVAGTVNDLIATELSVKCEELFIENGGDLYIKSKKDISVGIYARNKIFKDRIILKIRAGATPCGLCSSSGTFGHSFSMGKCDLAAVLSRSPITADAAATAVANSVRTEDDIEKSLEEFKSHESIKGLFIIKNDKIGIWGDLSFG